MDPTISVSKGCFVFKNARKSGKSENKRREASSNSLYIQSFRSLWQAIEQDITQLKMETYGRTLQGLIQFVLTRGNTDELLTDDSNALPAAVLLTGINQPDHISQFSALEARIAQEATPSVRVCMLHSHECSTLKSAIESMVSAFIGGDHIDCSDHETKRMRRSQYTMKLLEKWQKQRSTISEPFNGVSAKNSLVVILPDFECFSPAVLQDFILILSAYCETLPLILILGVATTITAVHTMLPYHVTSKIKLCVFEAQTAPVHMNKIIEAALLSPKYPFQLSGKALHFLMTIFLYYDFSINGFIQGYKYCLFEHFFKGGGNIYALCSTEPKVEHIIETLKHEDLECLRQLLSFRPYVEGLTDKQLVIDLLTDDNCLKRELPNLLKSCRLHFLVFRCLLEFLTELVRDLPKCPLGKQRREIYVHCMSSDITSTQEFIECWQILSIMSKQELVAKLKSAKGITEAYVGVELKDLRLYKAECQETVNAVLMPINHYVEKLEQACQSKQAEPKQLAAVNLQTRQELKAHLNKMCKESKPNSPFIAAVQETLDYIKTKIVIGFLRPLVNPPIFYELFVYKNINSLRRHIMGAPRAALHMALNNPHFYLQCKCCKLRDNTQLLKTLPDLSIVYKLHLECGRMINLFDWLQAFRTVVESNEDEEQTHINPEIQARFARAVAELQFLGYIKMSKRKTDHAMRLTW